MSTTMQKNDLGTEDLCDNIGLVGVFAKWSYMYVTSSPCHLDRAIPILSPLLFMHVDHPYISLFKIQKKIALLVKVFPDMVPFSSSIEGDEAARVPKTASSSS